jgi:hypothetical protein
MKVVRLIGLMVALALWIAVGWLGAGCSVVKSVGGEVGGHAAEWIACPTDLVNCGHVYMCDAFADNELGHIEICVDDDDHPEQLADVEAAYGECDLTPRHQGLCLFCCGTDCGRGGNAYNGTWCPDGAP